MTINFEKFVLQPNLVLARNLNLEKNFQLQDVEGCRVLGPLRRQLPRPHVHEGEGQGLPALRQVRVHPSQVVHARQRLPLQQVMLRKASLD